MFKKTLSLKKLSNKLSKSLGIYDKSIFKIIFSIITKNTYLH